MLKGRQTLPKKGFDFKWTSQEGFPASVVATIAMHKKEKSVTHPRTVDPQKRSINVTLVQEFYAHLTSPTQSFVYVGREQIQFTAAKINKFYGLQNTTDNHSKLVSGLKGKNNDFLLQDMCILEADWDSANTLVERDRLKPDGKLKKGVFESPEDHQKKGRLGITADSIPSLMEFDEAGTSKQPIGGARTIAAAKLAALITMAETTRDQLEELKTDLRTYFKYVQERDQVIKANFNEMLSQSSLNFPSFPQNLLKPAEAKMLEHTANQPKEKPLGSDSASSSPTPPDATPQHNSPPTQ
ncbi:hypothetical protein GQ457_08G032800 [Hibiscus cannabinus]